MITSGLRGMVAWRRGLAGLLVAGVFAASAYGQASGVPVEAVSRQAIGDVQSWDGTLQSTRQATIGAQAQGRIVKLYVRAGDKVRAGDRLADIDAREASLAVSRDQAQLGESQAMLAEARAVHSRSLELHRQGFISQAALDQAAAALRVAEARQRQAEAGIGLSTVATDHTLVRAPWDGVVTAVSVEVGDLAMPGRAMFEMVSAERLRAVVFLPNARVADLVAGGKAAVTVDDSAGPRTVSSDRLVAIPSSDPASATTEVRIELPDDRPRSPNWVPGRSVTVRFESRSGDRALTVPSASLLTRGELVGVYVATANGFVLRAVRTGRRSGDRVEVLSGLKEGERVALDPVRAGLKGALPVDR
jgi:RND family efflux transporter MFP subunit